MQLGDSLGEGKKPHYANGDHHPRTMHETTTNNFIYVKRNIEIPKALSFHIFQIFQVIFRYFNRNIWTSHQIYRKTIGTHDVWMDKLWNNYFKAPSPRAYRTRDFRQDPELSAKPTSSHEVNLTCATFRGDLCSSLGGGKNQSKSGDLPSGYLT